MGREVQGEEKKILVEIEHENVMKTVVSVAVVLYGIYINSMSM